jgi:hypothetical protein
MLGWAAGEWELWMTCQFLQPVELAGTRTAVWPTWDGIASTPLIDRHGNDARLNQVMEDFEFRTKDSQPLMNRCVKHLGTHSRLRTSATLLAVVPVSVAHFSMVSGPLGPR